ncbi:hypothetical protein UFOVP1349_10 [uncultured Caudovirales phage]|uniref:PD-(D/E)XK endonuclease-like domain-containing protein n=1 Tax=uncultured Caudovirales phage TaxID=2100421 RepID=A0A6J5SJX1_9CAUD|nr:hypothetical protein UFOVP925_33 [uncultured Caudovirales phage]CAB4183979.1 hypothetical protein UFOVP1097_16 [uncultured Caudovirales phage]CAB4199737.1 hypothetical protein UFOVP1349_10 [uncultured Caudovirales phage]CAB4214570.1 hypothetical protein UFOVP1456_47 [uncultured Caudovirales phage]
MKLQHYSPSSLNLFCAAPAMFILEKVLGHRQPVGSPAHRGTAVEAGVTAGLMEPNKPLPECIAVAEAKYDQVTALSSDARRADYRETIGGMVTSALEELRPYGVPSHTQGKVEWYPEGLSVPILGYYDFHWADHNITTDLKTTEKLPSAVKIAHARQVSLYVTSNNADPRASYITPKKRATYRVDNINEHRAALHQIALRVEKFLSLSDDPQFFTDIIAPDFESFYWGGPARQIGFEVWKF